MWASFWRVLTRWRSPHEDGELADELSTHLELAEAEYVARGLAPDDARRAARLALGSPAQIHDAVRDAHTARLDTLGPDRRYGLRQLRRPPGFTAVALLSLGVGTAGTITVFAFANAMLFAPLAVKDSGALIRVMGLGGDTTRALSTFSEAHIPAQDFFHYRDENETFTSLAAHFIGGPPRVRAGGSPRGIRRVVGAGNE